VETQERTPQMVFMQPQRLVVLLRGRPQVLALGDPSSNDADKRPGLINRTWLDVGRYREDAQALGRAEEDLEGLVARWRTNLERARRGTLSPVRGQPAGAARPRIHSRATRSCACIGHSARRFSTSAWSAAS
jgi:hypothetical protein